MSDLKEAARLEAAWAGEFGNDYSHRNKSWLHRKPFWRKIMKETAAESILEVGCNTGHNLVCIDGKGRDLYGIDINLPAVVHARKRLPDAMFSVNTAKSLPWKDNKFDLVFTMGVLIHQPDESLHMVMSEIVRCSKQWVLCAEYTAQETTPVAYRGLEASLFKRDYETLYLKSFPLILHEEGFLSKNDGFDNITWQLFRKV